MYYLRRIFIYFATINCVLNYRQLISNCFNPPYLDVHFGQTHILMCNFKMHLTTYPFFKFIIWNVFWFSLFQHTNNERQLVSKIFSKPHHIYTFINTNIFIAISKWILSPYTYFDLNIIWSSSSNYWKFFSRLRTTEK